MQTNLTEVTIEYIKNKYKNLFIDDDLLLFEDFLKLPKAPVNIRLQYIFVALCLKGKAQYQVDATSHEVAHNDVIIINSSQVLNKYSFSEDFKSVGFLISVNFFRDIIENVHDITSLFLFARNHPVSKLNRSEAKVFYDYFKMLKAKMSDTTHHFRKDVVRMLISTMIYDLGNTIYRIMNTSQTHNSRADYIFTNFMRLLEQEFHHERRVGWYAQQLCISPKYLTESVKLASNRTTSMWIDSYTIKELRFMVRESTMSMKEIAREMHFPSQSFMSKYFKEKTGVTPSEYRQNQI